MAATYEPIATTTLGSTSATVTFSSIPSTYTDLVLIISAGMGTGPGYAYLYFNNDTGANYSRTEVNGNGSSAASARFSNQIPISIDTGLGSSVNRINIMNYSNSTTYKTSLWRSDVPAGITDAGVGLWRSTSAITRIDLTGYSTTTFASGSVFTLYGITAA